MFKYMTLIAVFSLLVPATLAAQTQDFAVNVREDQVLMPVTLEANCSP